MPKAVSFVTNSFGVGGYFSTLKDTVKVISLSPKPFKIYKTMSIMIYCLHEAECLFTNAEIFLSKESLQMPNAALIVL